MAFGYKILLKYAKDSVEMKNDKILSKFLEKETFFSV